MASEYEESGFKNRREYLESLMADYGRDKVLALSSVLGPSEDFDGLITMLEDSLDEDDSTSFSIEGDSNGNLASGTKRQGTAEVDASDQVA